ncbi:serine/threonine-protein kinase CDG1-like [Bidens hawaiensis]|uniref:serine/threonine-protein kinase CDG1-like n=1 Tax=Bidens hawaiensis TaxID=980011 RepID=UPI00404B3242
MPTYSEASDGTSSSSEDIAAMSFDEYCNDYLYIPSKEIEAATNNFADENLLKRGTSFEIYKGQLLQSGGFIDIVARVPLQTGVALNELRVTRNFNHKNLVSPFKISYNFEDQRITINKREVNESLDKHLSSQTLTWMQRLHICVGVARALSYLHYDADDDHYVIHGNIKSSKILLDHNWEPMLHGFAFAVRAKKHDLHLTSKYNGALPYMDPAYEDTGGLTHKSDVFSFGVMLFEVLFGREASIPNNDKWYFARLARSHYEERKLDDLIAPDLWKKMNLQSFNIFAETAYCCLKEKRSQRPNMNQILLRLEKALELQHKHEHLIIAGRYVIQPLEGKNS